MQQIDIRNKYEDVSNSMSFHSLASNKSWRDSSESGDNGSETHVTSVIREKERKVIME